MLHNQSLRDKFMRGHAETIQAEVEAMLEPRFNLASLQATTHPVAPLLIVHGPIAQKLGLNSGAGAFGPSSLANAVIGRAIRLILLNVGGAAPGDVDRATSEGTNRLIRDGAFPVFDPADLVAELDLVHGLVRVADGRDASGGAGC